MQSKLTVANTLQIIYKQSLRSNTSFSLRHMLKRKERSKFNLAFKAILDKSVNATKYIDLILHKF
jgi:hypothetical protein